MLQIGKKYIWLTWHSPTCTLMEILCPGPPSYSVLYCFRASADDILETAKRVVDALDNAKVAQDNAQTAIDQATSDIQNAEGDLAMVNTISVFFPPRIIFLMVSFQIVLRYMHKNVDSNGYLVSILCVFSIQIETDTASATDTSNKTLAKIKDLKDRLAELKNKYTENEIKVQNAEKAADEAEGLANQAEQVSNCYNSHDTEFMC